MQSGHLRAAGTSHGYLRQWTPVQLNQLAFSTVNLESKARERWIISGTNFLHWNTKTADYPQPVTVIVELSSVFAEAALQFYHFGKAQGFYSGRQVNNEFRALNQRCLDDNSISPLRERRI